MAGITGYGAYIPRLRLGVEDIWDAWVNPTDTAAIIKKRRGLTEKAVTRWDEDSVTMAIYAAKSSLEVAGISAKELNAIYFGSCTNPYSSGSSGAVIAEALGTVPELLCADCQFTTKSGTAVLQVCLALVEAEIIRYGLAIGSDSLSRHVPPNDALEYSASAGAAAFVVGKEQVIAEIEGMYSYTMLTPEFFRLSGERYIKHGASEDDEYLWGYSRVIRRSVEGYLKKYGCKAEDFVYVALSQPDGQMPLSVSKEIGFSEEQVEPGLIATEIGDCGSASSALSLVAILDQAKPGQRILMISYGFGAGCDVLGIKTTNLLEETRKRRATYPSLRDLIDKKEHIDYAQSLKQERKLIQEYV
jgi:3-hydroxy-3-methylglutaryl CoA synthase